MATIEIKIKETRSNEKSPTKGYLYISFEQQASEIPTDAVDVIKEFADAFDKRFINPIA